MRYTIGLTLKKGAVLITPEEREFVSVISDEKDHLVLQVGKCKTPLTRTKEDIVRDRWIVKPEGVR